MRAKLLHDTMAALIGLNRTVCIEGAPGGGKTTIVRDLAKSLNLHYIEKHLPTMLVEDFGIPLLPSPDAADQVLSYITPDWFPAKGGVYDDGRGGVLCFDDRNQADASIQKVLANICQAKNLHGVEMAPNWTVVSTGNRQSDRAGANKVLSHLRNRETVLQLETHLDDSTNWMAANGVAPEVVAFIRFRPDLLHKFEPTQDINPTPRSWVEGVSPVIGIVPHDAEYECYMGAVGEGAGAEFKGFLQICREMVDPDVAIAKPDTTEVPDKPSVQFAITAAVAYRATQENFGNVIRYLNRMAPEFGVLGVSIAVKRDPELQFTQAFTDWGIKNINILL